MSASRVGLLVAFISGSAAAQCGACANESSFSLRDGEQNVPTNVILFARYAAPTPSTVTMTKSLEETQVPLRFSSGPGSSLWTIAPESSLEPLTNYELVGPLEVVRFTTGEGEDHTAPDAPVLKNVNFTPRRPNACAFDSWELILEGGSDDSTPQNRLLIFVQTQGSNEPADARFNTPLASPTKAVHSPSRCS